MDKWEYRLERLALGNSRDIGEADGKVDQFLDRINELGADGWEAVGPARATGMLMTSAGLVAPQPVERNLLLFKRRLKV